MLDLFPSPLPALPQDKVLSIRQRDEEAATCFTGENLLTLAATYYTILLRQEAGESLIRGSCKVDN